MRRKRHNVGLVTPAGRGAFRTAAKCLWWLPGTAGENLRKKRSGKKKKKSILVSRGGRLGAALQRRVNSKPVEKNEAARGQAMEAKASF